MRKLSRQRHAGTDGTQAGKYRPCRGAGRQSQYRQIDRFQRPHRAAPTHGQLAGTAASCEGGYEFAGVRYKLVDLPGTYSRSCPVPQDEEIARDFILFGQPDCTIVVTDATALERNLNLALQVLEISDKVVVCVNLMDEARRKGLAVDTRSLACDLGVPCVTASARTGEGLRELITTVADVIEGNIHTQPHRVTAARTRARRRRGPADRALAPGLPNARWVAMRLLDGDLRARALESGELSRIFQRQQRAARGSSMIALEGAQ